MEQGLRKIEKNVMDKIRFYSDEIGKFEANEFVSDLDCYYAYGNYDGIKIESPIEQILYCALKAVIRFNYLEDETLFDKKEGKPVILGFNIVSQYRIGKYRCDFLIIYNTPFESKELIIECDSQEFHERDEQQRRYEKARDRFFIIKGYKVFHFTGKEIIANSGKIATEIIAYLSGIKQEALTEDSNFK